MNIPKNLIKNGDFANRDLTDWQADNITDPVFNDEKDGSVSLKLEPQKYFHQDIDRTYLTQDFRLTWQFDAAFHEQNNMGGWIVILIVAFKEQEMYLENSVAIHLNDTLQTFTHRGSQVFPAGLTDLAFQVINANKVIEEGLSNTPINVTNFKLEAVNI